MSYTADSDLSFMEQYGALVLRDANRGIPASPDIAYLREVKDLRPLDFRGPEAAVSNSIYRVESVLGQAKGQVAPEACTNCAENRGPYLSCVLVPGRFGGSCCNCHYLRANCSFMRMPRPPTPVTPRTGVSTTVQQSPHGPTETSSNPAANHGIIAVSNRSTRGPSNPTQTAPSNALTVAKPSGVKPRTARPTSTMLYRTAYRTRRLAETSAELAGLFMNRSQLNMELIESNARKAEAYASNAVEVETIARMRKAEEERLAERLRNEQE